MEAKENLYEDFISSSNEIICLIDSSVYMRPVLHHVFYFLLNYQKKLLIQNDSTKLGIIFFNSKKNNFQLKNNLAKPAESTIDEKSKQDSLDIFNVPLHPHICTAFPLEQANIKYTKYIEKFYQDLKYFDKLIGSHTPNLTIPEDSSNSTTTSSSTASDDDYSSALKFSLWECATQFYPSVTTFNMKKKIKKKKSIWLFTNNDSPFLHSLSSSSFSLPESFRSKLKKDETFIYNNAIDLFRSNIQMYFFFLPMLVSSSKLIYNPSILKKYKLVEFNSYLKQITEELLSSATFDGNQDHLKESIETLFRIEDSSSFSSFSSFTEESSSSQCIQMKDFLSFRVATDKKLSAASVATSTSAAALRNELINFVNQLNSSSNYIYVKEFDFNAFYKNYISVYYNLVSKDKLETTTSSTISVSFSSLPVDLNKLVKIHGEFVMQGDFFSGFESFFSKAHSFYSTRRLLSEDEIDGEKVVEMKSEELDSIRKIKNKDLLINLLNDTYPYFYNPYQNNFLLFNYYIDLLVKSSSYSTSFSSFFPSNTSSTKSLSSSSNFLKFYKFKSRRLSINTFKLSSSLSISIQLVKLLQPMSFSTNFPSIKINIDTNNKIKNKTEYSLESDYYKQNLNIQTLNEYLQYKHKEASLNSKGESDQYAALLKKFIEKNQEDSNLSRLISNSFSYSFKQEEEDGYLESKLQVKDELTLMPISENSFQKKEEEDIEVEDNAIEDDYSNEKDNEFENQFKSFINYYFILNEKDLAQDEELNKTYIEPNYLKFIKSYKEVNNEISEMDEGLLKNASIELLCFIPNPFSDFAETISNRKNQSETDHKQNKSFLTHLISINKSPVFIYPLSSLPAASSVNSFIKNSNNVFELLLRECIEEDVIPIVKYVAQPSIIDANNTSAEPEAAASSSPLFAFLLPQLEEDHNSSLNKAFGDDDLAEFSSSPQGFHLLTLPFAENLRVNPIHIKNNLTLSTSSTKGDDMNFAIYSENLAEGQQLYKSTYKNLISTLISHFTLTDSVSSTITQRINNPIIQYYYSAIERFVFNKGLNDSSSSKLSSEFFDETLENSSFNKLKLNINWIKGKEHKYLPISSSCPICNEQHAMEVDEDKEKDEGYDEELELFSHHFSLCPIVRQAIKSIGDTIAKTEKAPAVPQKRSSANDGTKEKKPKVDDEDVLTEEDKKNIQDLIQSNSLSSLTVDKLKVICKKIGAKVSGSKKDLIERISAFK